MDTKFFGIPFAATGDKTAIPVDQQVDGSVSYPQGWGPDYEADLLTDPNAKPVERDATNQLNFDITSALGAMQKQGAPQYITAADNGGAAFGYARGARVLYGSPLRPFVSRVDSNTALPTVAANWQAEAFELATNAQAIAGTQADVLITPPALAAALAAASVSVPDASTTVKGIQRNATNAEAVAGTLATATVTPAALTAAVASMVPQASTTVVGRTRYATVAEAGAASAATVAVTPAGLAQTKNISWTTGLQDALDAKAPLVTPVFSSPTTVRGPVSGETRMISDAASGRIFSLRSVVNAGVAAFEVTDLSAGAVLARWVAGGAFTQAGNMSVGGSLAVSSSATVAGSVTASGGFQNSSRTVKDDRGPMPYGLAEVLKMQPVMYGYKPEACEDTSSRVGFYAEDLAQVIPEAVRESDGPSPLVVDYSQVFTVLVRAIQEQHEQIQKLTERLK